MEAMGVSASVGRSIFRSEDRMEVMEEGEGLSFSWPAGV